jgi:hypothetical protein
MTTTALPPDLEQSLEGLRRSGDGWVARCPTHEDRNPSLSLKVTETGKVLAHCHAGCDQTRLVEALGLDKGSGSAEWTPHGDAVAVYDYRDENGQLLFQVLRTADKQFPQRRPDPTVRSGWRWSLGDTRRVLFRLPELISAVAAGATVYVCEGEKDVLALVALGKAATCNPGGAGKWRAEYAEFFRGARVIVCGDKDQPGQQHARTVAASLRAVDAKVWIAEAEDPHKDVAAHLGAGLSLEALVITHRPDQPARQVDPDFLGGGATAPAATASAAPSGAVVPIAADVAAELQRLRVRDQAATLLRAEKAAATPGEPFDAAWLREVLARPEPPRDRIDGLLPWAGAMVLTAMRKTGKTTLVLNLTRSLLTGEPFLGRFNVRPINGAVGFLNYEVSGAQLARWADDVGVDPDRFYLVNLRGRRNPLSHPDDQAALAADLRAHHVESLIVDPFGRAFAGLSQNDAGEVGTWLANLDRFARTQVGALDLVLTAHAGWTGERTRGSSALEDWGDSLVTVTLGKDEDEDHRYLRAVGRDVDVDEDQLHFDPRTRLLRMSGAGSRRKATADRKITELVPEVLAVVIAEPGISATAITDRLRDRGVTFQKGTESKAVQNAVTSGALRVEQVGRSKRYFSALPETTFPTAYSPPPPAANGPANPPLPNVPQLSPASSGDSPHTPIYRGGDSPGDSEPQNDVLPEGSEAAQ